MFSSRGLTLALFAGILGLPPWVDAAIDRPPAKTDRLAERPIRNVAVMQESHSRWDWAPVLQSVASSALATAGVEPAVNAFLVKWSSVELAEPAATHETVSTSVALAPHPSDNGFNALPEVQFYARNQQRTIQCRLYSSSGAIDEVAAQKLDQFLADVRDPKQPKIGQIDRRLLQLVFRVAYHFEARQINVLSAYREQTKRREGLHALGRALDFSIPGVKPQALASYLRTLPKVGVGVYTHRRTRFVHLDVREQSYHWLDASPPGRTWRGVSIGNRSLVTRDRNYDPKDDLPEGLSVSTRSSGR